MTAFDNAKKFFEACEASQGWAGCQNYVADGASFSAQSEPLADIKTVRDYCEWMAGIGQRTAVAVSRLGKIKTILQMTGVTMLLFRNDVLGLPIYQLGLWLTVVAAGLTLFSMGLYLRAAWPHLSAST